MPIPPRPRTYSCPVCDWSKTVVPRSDVLLPGTDHFDTCPACRHAPLAAKPAHPAQVVLSDLTEKIKRLLR